MRWRKRTIAFTFAGFDFTSASSRLARRLKVLEVKPSDSGTPRALQDDAFGEIPPFAERARRPKASPPCPRTAFLILSPHQASHEEPVAGVMAPVSPLQPPSSGAPPKCAKSHRRRLAPLLQWFQSTRPSESPP